MNELLPQILAEFNLQPGQCRRVQVNGYQLEIRRPAEEESDFGDTRMMEPWAVFPRGDPNALVPLRFAPHPLPVPPEIPPDEEEMT